MEYTKDVIFNVKYSKKLNFINKVKGSKFMKKFKTLIQKDECFTLTIIISIIALTVDYLIIKRFIEILNIL